MPRLEIVKLPSSNKKKYKAIFTRDDGSIKTVEFGDQLYSDYTQHGDKKRREAYLMRHRKNEDWDNPESPGALSRYILWGDSKNLLANIHSYRRKFGYQ